MAASKDRFGGVLFRFGCFVVLLTPILALGADFPMSQKALLSEDSVKVAGASSDGRLIVTLGSQKARYFDAYASRTFDPDDTTNVVSVACTDPVGVYIAEVGSSTYYVHIPCESGGKVYQFKVEASTDFEHPMALQALTDDAGAASLLEIDALSSIKSAAFDEQESILYLAGAQADVISNSSAIYSLVASTLAAVPDWEQELILTNMTPTVLEVWGDGLLALDQAGKAYLLRASGNLSDTYGCDTTPRDVMVLGSDLAIVLGEDNLIYLITQTGSGLECEGYDWQFESTPSSMGLLTHDGAGNSLSPDLLYIRGVTSGGDLAVYKVPSTPSGATPIYEIQTDEPVDSDDIMVATELSRVYLGTSKGLYVFAEGPWLTVDAEEPVVVTDVASSFSFSLTTDAVAVDLCLHYSLDAPYSSSCIENISGPLDASGTISVDIDTADLVLEDEYTQLFIYGKDENDNLGWASLWIRKIETPVSLAGFKVTFGTTRLYLSFNLPEDANRIDMLITDQPFTIPDQLEDDSVGWFEYSTLVVGDTEYPPGGEAWPMDLGFPSEENDETSAWTTDGSTVTYRLEPLENAATYYISLRPVMDSVAGAWTVVKEGTPEETCGAVCIAGDTGGFCVYNPACNSLDGKGRRSNLPVGMWLVAGVWLVHRRRRSEPGRDIRVG